MKRDKKENGNILIYLGTIIFFVLAIIIGIVVYNTTKTESDNENSTVGNKIEDELVVGKTENVSNEIGKTVEEKNKIEEEQKSQTTEISETKEPSNTEKVNTPANTKKEKSNTSEVKQVEKESNVKTTKKEITFIKPVEGEIIYEYAKDNLIYSETLKEWVTHTGIDIKADKTSVIKSAADGIIKSIVNDPRYGLTVIIEHDDGFQTVYSNLLTAEFIVEGEEVKQGQTIGTAGNTASFESEMDSHLHFEILKDGETLNPSIYLK